MRTIAVVNQKGGCGKTTTAVNMAAAFAELGRRVLLVDFDSQAHATIGLGKDPDAMEHSVYDCVLDPDVPLSGIIIHCEAEHLDLVPSGVLLASAELELAAAPDKELRLARALRRVRDSYDLCVIDSPASVGLLTLNALITSSDVVVPVQVHYYALEGLKRLLETVRFIRDRFHPYSMENIRLLLTFVEERVAFSRKIQQQLRDIFGDLVLDTVIHRDNRLAEAPSTGVSILCYSSRSKGASDYRALASEILTGSPTTSPVATQKVGKGIQKHLATLFERVWIPHGTRSYDPGSVDAT
jgi:chromosome partitioning protein